MSLDTTTATTHQNGSVGSAMNEPPETGDASVQSSLTASQWSKLQRSILARAKKKSPQDVLGAAAADGSIYRWGVAGSQGGPCGDLVEVLSRLAVDVSPKKSLFASIDLATSVEVFIDRVTGPSHSASHCARAVLWAAALPSLIERIDTRLWWDLLGTLQQLRESTLQLNATSSPATLMLGGELGLTLGWRLSDLPSCKRLAKSAVAEIDSWFAQEADSISVAVSGAIDTRLVLASVVRCQRLLEGTRKAKLKKRQIEIASDLVVWAAGFTLPGGISMSSKASSRDVRDDTAPDGLLRASIVFDPETLAPATSAALGESRSNGKLAWQVSLPEAMQHSDDAKVAVMLPEWDVRRGRVHVDYSGEETRVELFAGRHQAISGNWQVMIEVDGDEQQAKGDWTYTCEYSDDDVHYLELEQPWSGGIVLQRQFMLAREDRCVLLADTVVSSDAETTPNSKPNVQPRKIRYTARLPIGKGLEPKSEPETREVFLCDTKQRAMVVPLSANEWRIGPTTSMLHGDNECLVLDVTAQHAMYAPIWFDFQTRRFGRPRTWRQLTIADELRIVSADEASGFRIQAGSEQWLVYRSLGERRCRTVLGKHLIADFFSGRFDPEDGNIEELVTVDDSESFEEE